jgi:hypothetical protein
MKKSIIVVACLLIFSSCSKSGSSSTKGHTVKYALESDFGYENVPIDLQYTDQNSQQINVKGAKSGWQTTITESKTSFTSFISAQATYCSVYIWVDNKLVDSTYSNIKQYIVP